MTAPTPALFDVDAAGAETTSARLSTDGVYRYRLDRTWSPDGGRLLFVMLNPSTADATEDDNTIRRCRGFAKREGAGGFTVVNLFALRATNPAALAEHPDPVGPACEAYLRFALADTPTPVSHVIAAWGAHKFATDRATEVTDLLLARGRLWCLGVTKSGAPRHPLYVKGNAPLRPYPLHR